MNTLTRIAFSSFFVFVLVSSMSGVVSAESPNIGPIRANTDLRVKAEMERKSANQENRSETNKDNQQKREDRFKNYFENFSARFNNVIDHLVAIDARMEKLASRIDSRIEKMKAENVDVSVAAKFMVTAREDLRLAKVAIDDAQASFKIETATTAAADATIDTYRTLFTKTIANIKEAKAKLMNAHRDMVQAIMSMGHKDEKKMDSATRIEVKAKANQ